MLEAFWNGIQVFATGVIAIGGAGAIFVGLYRWAKKPDINRDEKIKEHEDKLVNDFQRINELEKKQEKMDADLTIIMQSLTAIMTHAIDGNHTEELKKKRDAMMDYLSKRR